MKWHDLKPGKRLELNRLTDDADDAQYISQLLAPVEHDQAILVAMPIHRCRFMVWPPGARLRVSLVEPGRGIWTFTARIGSAGTVGAGLDRIRTYVLQAESEPVRCQRRAHFRVDCLLEASLDRVPGAESAGIRAVTQNISGGGACIVTDEPPTGAGRIELVLPADGAGRRIVAGCRIVRCEATWAAGQPKHRVSLRFTDISRADQDALVRYLMQLQLRQKQQETRP